MPGEPPYGPPILEAIARGELAEMKTLAAEAERFLEQHGDVKSLLEVLKVEIARRSGGEGTTGTGGNPDYGPAIQEAIARGDLAEMKAVLKRAETTLQRQGELATAVAELRVEIAKLERK